MGHRGEDLPRAFLIGDRLASRWNIRAGDNVPPVGHLQNPKIDLLGITRPAGVHRKTMARCFGSFLFVMSEQDFCRQGDLRRGFSDDVALPSPGLLWRSVGSLHVSVKQEEPVRLGSIRRGLDREPARDEG